MKKNFLFFFFLIFPFFSFADEGLYVSGFGGADFKPNRKDRETQAKIEYQTGYYAAGAVGYKWNFVRLESELSYHHNSLKKIKIHDFEIKIGGNQHAWGALGNIYFDLDFIPCFSLKPYVGGGIGYAHSKIKISKKAFVTHIATHKNGLAWQILAGISYSLSECVDVAIEYRYFHTNIKDDQNHNVGGGLRLWF